MTTNKSLALAGALCLLLVACNHSTDYDEDFLGQPENPPVAERPPTFSTNEGLLSPEARLRKLSLHLRGITPETAEYDALKRALAIGQAPAFFSDSTARYLGTAQHLGKMVDRLDDLFRVALAGEIPENTLNAAVPPASTATNALDLLFAQIVRNNLPWDTLLSGKEYTVVFPQELQNVIGITDNSFFGELVPGLPPNASPFLRGPEPTTPVAYPIKFSADDPRIAGAITTGRFFARYNTTNLNKNRGRAAAVFRIFLCDEMQQVVQGGPGEEAKLVDQAFPDPKPAPIHEKFHAKEDPHGNQPACMACHYKLDPLGRSFLTSSTALSPLASPGSLSFKRSDGTPVRAAARGLGDLGQQILSEPDYARCQVKHFWNWFVDGNSPPSEDRLNELVAMFNETGHRTNDFIARLVNIPEFYRDPNFTDDNLTLTQVKETLARCDQCHSGQPGEPIPSFVKFPVGGSEATHRGEIKKLVEALDLAHDGAKALMPPTATDWKPTAIEMTNIKRWIAGGVKDEAGQVTVEPSLAEGWLKP